MGRRNRRSYVMRERWRRHHEASGRSVTDSSNVAPCEVASEISVQASHSQSDDRFSDYSRGNQCLTNSLMFLTSLHESDRMDPEDLDDVLRAGDQLYCQIRQSLEIRQTFVSRHLNFDDVPDTVEMDGGCYRVVKSNPLNGLLLQNAPDGWENYSNLSLRLDALGSSYSQALLIIGGLCISVFKDKRGRFGLFDPHSRNASGSCCEENGKAVMVTFRSVNDLTNRLIQLFFSSLCFEEDKEYHLLPIRFETIKMKANMEGNGASNHKVAQNNTLASMVSSKLSKRHRMKAIKRLQRKQQALTDSGNDGKKIFKTSPEKLAELRMRYRSDLEFRRKKQQYMNDRYKNDPDFKEKQLQLSKLQYQRKKERELYILAQTERAANQRSNEQTREVALPQKPKVHKIKETNYKRNNVKQPTIHNARAQTRRFIKPKRTRNGEAGDQTDATVTSSTPQFITEDLSGPIITEVRSLAAQTAEEPPVSEQTCSICHRSVFVECDAPEVPPMTLNGTCIYICKDNCIESGVCIMSEMKKEWICPSCDERFIVVIA